MNNFLKLIKIKARNIKRSLRRNLEAIWMCILLLSPFLSLYFERKKYSIIAQLFAIVLVIFLMYLDQYNYNKRHQQSNIDTCAENCTQSITISFT